MSVYVRTRKIVLSTKIGPLASETAFVIVFLSAWFWSTGPGMVLSVAAAVHLSRYISIVQLS